jgi:hypothetical protein
MGEYFADDRTGARHSFTIAGDKPSPIEMTQINAILSQGPQTATPAEPSEPKEEPGLLSTLGSGIARGWNETQAGADVAMQSFHEVLTGNKEAAKEWEEAAKAQRAERDTYAAPEGGFLDSQGFGKKAQAVAGTLGQSTPAMAMGMGGMYAGAATGAAIGSFAGPLGTAAGSLVGGAIGGVLGYAPQMLNANAERQIEQHGYVKDWGKAYTATAAQSVIETATDRLGLKVLGYAVDGAKVVGKGLFAKTAEKQIRDGIEVGIKEALTITAKKVGVGTATQAVSGATEEVLQQGMERWQADMALMDDEAKKEYIESAVMGGIVESIFGAGAGAVSAKREVRDRNALAAAKKDVDAEANTLASYGATPPASALPTEPAPDVADPAAIAPAPDPSVEIDADEIIAKKEASLPEGLKDKEVKKNPVTPKPLGARTTLLGLRKLGYSPADLATVTPEHAQVLVRNGIKAEDFRTNRSKFEALLTPRGGVVPEVTPTEAVKDTFGTETEYRNAIKKLGEYDSVSVDRIKKVMGVKKEQAQSLFAELLRRQDAHPTGTKDQYLSIILPPNAPVTDNKRPRRVRGFAIRPVPSSNPKPFAIEIDGKKLIKKFATQEEALAHVGERVPEDKRKSATVVEDKSSLQHGIYETHNERGKDKTEKPVSERLVRSFATEAEAKEALKGFDPTYSPESNKWNEQQSVEDKQSSIEHDLTEEVGPTIAQQMKAAGERVLGQGRVEVATPSNIPAPAHAPGAIVEGHSQNIETKAEGESFRGVVRNLITLARDIYNPNLNEDQRAKLMQSVLNHELVHALRSLDLLTRGEWDTLAQATTRKVPGRPYTWIDRAMARAPNSSPAMVEEEAIAEMVRHYTNDPTAFRGAERTILRKIADFIKKLMRISQRHDAEDLMDTIFEGGIADRDIGHGGLGPRNPDDIQFSLLKPDNLFLQSARFLESVTTEKAKKNDWIKMLSNPDTGIKKTELDWLSVIPWLQSLPKGEDIHRNDILNYVKASGPRISTTIFADTEHPDLGEAAQADPRWVEKSQSTGLDNYAEVAFTFPPRTDEPRFTDKGGHITIPAYDVAAKSLTRTKLENVLAFARFRDVMEGEKDNQKRILFIEEMQSDLHQRGSMKGYYSKSVENKIAQMRDQARATYQEVERLRQNTINISDDIWVIQKTGRHATHDGQAEIQEHLYRLQQNEADIKTHLNAHEQLVTAIKDANQRLTIPNAPFKSNWEDYVIRRMIRHAVEHGYHGIAWHGSPESVSKTEGYGELVEHVDDKGRKQYLAYGETSVGPIVNRYLIKLPGITRSLADPFGVTLEHNSVDRSSLPPDWLPDDVNAPPTYQHQELSDELVRELFPTPSAMLRMIDKITRGHEETLRYDEYLTDEDKNLATELVRKMQRVAQIARNRRAFDAQSIFDAADVQDTDLKHVIAWAETGDFMAGFSTEIRGEQGAKPTKFKHDHYRMDFNAQMQEAFEKGDQPYFSMVTPTAPQYSATAPLGQRVPVTPPINTLADVHRKITYDNVSPIIHKMIQLVLPPGEARKTAMSKVDDTFISLQDRMLPVGRLIDRIKKNGGFISNENDTYLRETLYSSQTDAHLSANERDLYKTMEKTIQDLGVTQADYNEAKRLSQNSNDILSRYNKNFKHALAELYVYAQHAVERNRVMRKRNSVWKKDAQGNIILDPNGDPMPVRDLQFMQGSGMEDGEAIHILDWFNSKQFARQFNDATNPNSVRSRLRAIVKNTNDVRVQAGLTPDFRHMTYADGTPVNEYEDYVPLRGFLAEASIRDDITDDLAKTGKGFNIRGKEDMAALGRQSLGADLIAHTMLQNQEAIVRAGKNKVTRSFRQLILDNPGEFADVANIVQLPKTKWGYDRERQLVVERTDMSLESNPKYLKGKLDGHTFYIELKDPRLVKAFGSKSGLGSSTGLNTLLKGMAYLNRILASTRTSWNPEFMISNMFRDLQSAMVNLSEYEMKGLQKKTVASVFPALNGVRRALRSGDRTSEWGKVFDEFQTYGGHTAVFGIKGLSDTLDRINAEFDRDVSGPVHKVWQPIKGLFKVIEDYNVAIENGTRLAAYKTLRDKYLEMSGTPNDPQAQKRAKEMAAFAAKNLTVNFNMGGESKSFMSALYMFFNASLQGSMALLNPLIRSGRMRKVWAGVVVAGIVQDALMSMLSPEDDDGEKTYDKIPDYVLEHNMVFMDPFGISERGYFKFPMPYMLNSIHNWGRMLGKTVRGKATMGEMLTSGGVTMLDSLNPWGGSNSLLNWVMPTVLDPVVDLYQNEDFTGKPIAPPISPYGGAEENRSQQYWNNTNPVYVTIADYMSKLTGRQGDFIPGAAEWSPNQVEYVSDWLTGGTGTFLARAGRLLYSGAQGELPEDIDAGDLPVLRKGYGQITAKNDLQDYIEGRDKVLRIRKALRDARKEGDNELYMQIMRNYPKEYKAAARVNAIENARKKMSSRIKKIRDSKRLSDERKEVLVKALKDRQNVLIGKGNVAMSGID